MQMRQFSFVFWYASRAYFLFYIGIRHFFVCIIYNKATKGIEHKTAFEYYLSRGGFLL